MGIAILVMLVLVLGMYFFSKTGTPYKEKVANEQFKIDWDNALEQKNLRKESDFKRFRELYQEGFKIATDDQYPKFLFIDFETTDLPPDYSLPTMEEIDQYPFIVQAGILAFNERGELISEYNSIIKTPEYLTYSPAAVRIHKITQKRSQSEGVEITEMLAFIKKHISGSTVLVAHNVKFDSFFLKLEAKRNGIKLPKVAKYCTMKETVELCALDKEHGSGYKYPKLKELVFYAFTNGENGNLQINLHDAMTDIKLCAMCFFELKLHADLSSNK
jgi:DNA polymerase-3 subunit epsilon